MYDDEFELTFDLSDEDEASESRIPCRNPSDALVSTSATVPAVATPMNNRFRRICNDEIKR